MWRIRLAHELPRYLLQGLAIVGLVASARFAIAPPHPVLARVLPPSVGSVDRAAEGFASLFVRRYLTWDSRDPEDRRLELAPFIGSSLEVDAGSQPPEGGDQRVLWTQVVQAHVQSSSERVYTVAAQTNPGGLLYLSVGVIRGAGGALALAGYPAFVGAPASTVAAPLTGLPEVEDPALVTVVSRALRNYLAQAGSELAADLVMGAHVSLPAAPLKLRSLDAIDWSSDRRSVIALVRASDEQGAQYTLNYELGVLASAGRWEVTAIQTNPDT